MMMSYIVTDTDGNDAQDCSPRTCPGGEHVLHDVEYSDSRAGTLLQMLINLDMAGAPTDQRVDLPLAPEGVTWSDANGWGSTLAGAAYQLALDAYWQHRRGVEYGIAGYKLIGGNDGWWVSVEECHEAIEVWESMGPSEQECQPEMVRRFVRMLRAAAAHHGFRVW